MNGSVRYEFTGIPWQHDGPGGWHFVTVPQNLSAEIRAFFQPMEQGWGRLQAIAQIGNTSWKTAIWYDTKQESYLLPLKAAIRKAESVCTGDDLQITIWI